MKKITFIFMLFLLLASATNAWAIVVDGTAGAGEWDDYILHLTDIDDPGIPNAVDIKDFWVAGGDTLFFRYDTFIQPPLDIYQYSYCETQVDFDGDGTAEYFIYYGWPAGVSLPDAPSSSMKLIDCTTARVYSYSSGVFTKTGEGDGAVGDIIEYSVPASSFGSDFPAGTTQKVWLKTRLDNSGIPADDGFDWVQDDITRTPEPFSAGLVLLGLMGLGIAKRRSGY